jgi:transposase
MTKLPYQAYTNEFREEAVLMVLNENIPIGKAAQELGILRSTLATWIKKYKEKGTFKNEQRKKPLNEKDAEILKLKKELAVAKMELEILKKAAAYFAKESL